MKVDIAEGLVIGPNDKLVVSVKNSHLWDDGAMEQFLDDLHKLVGGDRVVVLYGDNMQIAKVEGA